MSAGALLALGDNGFHPALENSPLQEHTPVASLTFDPNISTQSNYLPIVAATRVLFSEAHYVPQPCLHRVTEWLPDAC